MLFLAGQAWSMMTVPFTLMFTAVENLFTFFSTLEDLSLLAALDDSGAFAALT